MRYVHFFFAVIFSLAAVVFLWSAALSLFGPEEFIRDAGTSRVSAFRRAMIVGAPVTGIAIMFIRAWWKRRKPRVPSLPVQA